MSYNKINNSQQILMFGLNKVNPRMQKISRSSLIKKVTMAKTPKFGREKFTFMSKKCRISEMTRTSIIKKERK